MQFVCARGGAGPSRPPETIEDTAAWLRQRGNAEAWRMSFGGE
jgi:hypothetical protein